MKLNDQKVIEIKNISKQYRLGVIGHGTLYRDLQTWWARFRDLDDPNAKIFDSSYKEKENKNSIFFALKDLSLDINKGDIVGVIGRNGSGKSTLLKILSKITMPSTGLIRMKGRVASLLEVGTGFHSELTGRENIFLNGAILGMRKVEIEERFDQIVAFSELAAFIDTPVKRYSTGMIVRLAFAVAAHLESEVLIVDEVLAVGDVSFRKKCIEKMQSVSGQDTKTVLFVSHDMGSIRNLCNRVVVLDKGQIIYDGDVDIGIKKYLDINADHDSGGVFEYSEKGGDYPVYISKVSLKNKGGLTTSNFRTYDPIIIEVEISGTPPQNGFNLEWRLISSRGDALAFGGSYALANKTYSISDRILVCEIDSLPLSSGQYSFTLILRVWQQEAWSYIEKAASFIVESPPQLETGFEYELSNSGPLNLIQYWR